MIKRESF